LVFVFFALHAMGVASSIVAEEAIGCTTRNLGIHITSLKPGEFPLKSRREPAETLATPF